MSLTAIFDAFNHQKVLIIGDVMIDAYIFGKVERISPEAPVPVLNVKQRDYRLGGAGNVALNVQSLGANPVLCSVVGKDAHADLLIKLFENSQLSTEGLVQSETRITTVKERIVAGSHQIVRVDSEMDSLINETERTQLLERIKSLIKTCQVVIFEDYDKGVLGKEIIEEVVQLAQENNIPTIVDPKKRNFLYYAGVDLFKPNLKELKEGLKIDLNPDDALHMQETVAKAKESLGVKGMLLTMSEKGVYIDFDKKKHHLAAHVRQIADVSGAGDTVVSIAALCLSLKLSAKTIAALSNLGGGLVCESVGVVPIDKEKLKAEAKKMKLE